MISTASFHWSAEWNYRNPDKRISSENTLQPCLKRFTKNNVKQLVSWLFWSGDSHTFDPYWETVSSLRLRIYHHHQTAIFPAHPLSPFMCMCEYAHIHIIFNSIIIISQLFSMRCIYIFFLVKVALSSDFVV